LHFCVFSHSISFSVFSQMDHWLCFGDKHLKPPTQKSLNALNQSLKDKSYLVGEQLSIADLAVYEKMKSKQGMISCLRFSTCLPFTLANY
jgi:hypothetical protein